METHQDNGKNILLNTSIIPESHRDILESTALAYLATVGPHGEPQVSAVWFTWDGSFLLFTFNNKRQKYRNVLREPRLPLPILQKQGEKAPSFLAGMNRPLPIDKRLF